MKPSRNTILALLISGLAGVAVTTYQWLALLSLRTSNEKPLCAINEALNCGAIWDSPLSTTIHQYSGIPIAGWGFIWSALIIIFSGKLLLDSQKDKPNSLALSALFVNTIVGLIGVVALVLYSISLQVFCLSCIAFYIVTAVVAYIVLTKLSRDNISYSSGSGAALAATLILALALYLPGQNIPLQSVLNSPLVTANTASSDDQNNTADNDAPTTSNEKLKQFMAAQPIEALQAMSNFLAEYQDAKPINHATDSNRVSFGNAQSPVKIVEWLEITCPHCAQLSQQLTSIRNSTESDSWSLETRYYPLDSECNPNLSRSRNNGVSCLAAKSLICLSNDKAKAHEIQETFFANQKQLTTDMIRDIIRDQQVDMIELAACLESEATADALATDIAMAQDHDISGTPLVVMNGRALTAMPHLIYSLILSGGNDKATEFALLPKAEPISHEGHNH